MVPSISALMNDFAEDNLLLSEVGKSLAELAPERKKELGAWLDLPPSKDPDNNLLAKALEALWPESIDIDTLIKHLRPQKDYFTISNYRLFIRDLGKRIKKEEQKKFLNFLLKNF